MSEKGSERGTPGVGRHAVEAARLVSKKRVEAARTLLDLAAEASGLGEENWPVVLEVVSRMDALREAAELLEARRRTSEEEASEREEPPEVEQDSHDRHLARLVTCAREPLRFAREEAHEARERDAALVSVSSSTAIPSAPTGAEVALGAWLASAEGAAASRRVFADAARFDDVEATGFVAALAGVAVADVWAPAEDAAASRIRRSEAFRGVRSAKNVPGEAKNVSALAVGVPARFRGDAPDGGDCPFLARAPARFCARRSGARASRPCSPGWRRTRTPPSCAPPPRACT